jgi:hypothetical protein
VRALIAQKFEVKSAITLSPTMAPRYTTTFLIAAAVALPVGFAALPYLRPQPRNQLVHHQHYLLGSSANLLHKDSRYWWQGHLPIFLSNNRNLLHQFCFSMERVRNRNGMEPMAPLPRIKGAYRVRSKLERYVPSPLALCGCVSEH